MTRTPTDMAAQEGPRIVGIGASAGGLDALEKFFKHVALDTHMAYVVVQHTSPEHKTLLGTLLQEVTHLPVHDARNGVVVAANAVYITPTGGELTVERGCLHFHAAKKPVSAHLPIDAFFKSLAEDQGPRAVGVILSGMGRDGVAGVQAIHDAKGLCLAQLPETAAFAAMPQSAIETGCIDRVAAPQEMPPHIVNWVTQEANPSHPPNSKAPFPELSVPTPSSGELASIVQLLREQLHHDFSLYKPSTLQRRIVRRQQIHQLPSMAAYKTYLQNNPSELALLFSEMLIGVTAFFRDAQVWQDLATLVIPRILTTQPNLPIRAWVMGCSTGEEAYSLAMVLREALDASGLASRRVQIYATDLNPAAISVARKGWYGASALATLSASQIDRFFTPHQGGFLVHPDIRSMVMFAKHDVTSDPPFTQLDLLMCRNVLIYFNASLQLRLIPLFHFSLRTGGILVLGSAETVGKARQLFSALVPKSRIFHRLEPAGQPGAVVFPVQRHPRALAMDKDFSLTSSAPKNTEALQTLADHVLLQSFSPSAVVVNAAGDILYISGRTGLYLEPAAGKANWNIHAMVRPALREPIALALHKALQDQQAVILSKIRLTGSGGDTVQVTVHPFQAPPPLANTAMVIFKEVVTETLANSPHDFTGSDVNNELQAARIALQNVQLEMQTSTDQLCATNDALKVANEELQLSNEELTTSKEESQSMNEELQTINNELQTRLDDLALAQSDMQNLLNSTDIATLFLDNDLNVRRYTEKAVEIFHLREVDVGRPLSDLTNILFYPELSKDVKETLAAVSPCTKSVAANDGRWFSVRIMPYRTLANAVNGAVLTFVDISTAKALEFRLRETQLPLSAAPKTP
jgi:two-component system, chemotaxis family, CheB/CheR fusion protein